MEGSRFEDLLRLWQDDEASASDLAELAELLKGDPELRREVVRASLLEVHLYRHYAGSLTARRTSSRRSLEAAAAIVVLAVSSFLLGRLFLRSEDSTPRVTSGEVWSDGARAAVLREGHPFEVRGGAPASIRLPDGSTLALAPGSAGTLGTEGRVDLTRGGGTFGFRGRHRVVTPEGTLATEQADLQILLRKLPRELVLEVSQGTVRVEAYGRHETVLAGERQRYSPPPPPGGVDYARLFEGATVDLGGAIDRATATAGGGIPLQAVLENEDGRPVFSVRVAVDRRVREFDVDPKTGTILEEDTEEEDHSRLASALKLPLKAALARALELYPGRPVEAEVEEKKGRVRIELKILDEQGLRRLEVDPETGDVRLERK